MGAGHFLAVVMLLGTRARRHLFRVPAFPRVATSHAGPRAVNGLAAGQGVACSVAAVTLSLSPPSQADLPAWCQQGRAVCFRAPGAQAEALQRGAREALRGRQAIPAPGRWRDPPSPWRQGQRSVPLTSSAPGARSGWAPCSVKLRFYSCLLRCGPVGPLPITPRSKSL